MIGKVYLETGGPHDKNFADCAVNDAISCIQAVVLHNSNGPADPWRVCETVIVVWRALH